MPCPTAFPLFRKLPIEVQSMIWKFHRERSEASDSSWRSEANSTTPRPTTFPRFRELPETPEKDKIQEKIWKFYREQRGVRHCLTETPDASWRYEAIDLDTRLFANTLLTDDTANKYWKTIPREDIKPREYKPGEKRPGPSKQPYIDIYKPINGECDDKILLPGAYTTAEPGGDPYSASEGKRIDAPCIRANYKKDIFMLRKRGISGRGLFPKLDDENVPNRGHIEAWLPHAQYLALDASSEHVMFLQDRLPRMKNLKHIYVVANRDPMCPYGAPRSYGGFERTMLDEWNFLPYDKFEALHPKSPGMTAAGYPCPCVSYMLHEGRLMHRNYIEWLAEKCGIRELPISLVVDPYT
ncbi:hypothetical protein F5Y10DRAFT_123724 [Nemania abortiva]|nr:hypothetical protein F5Y10DRAFT_123724 [Nemania abortiva]